MTRTLALTALIALAACAPPPPDPWAAAAREAQTNCLRARHHRLPFATHAQRALLRTLSLPEDEAIRDHLDALDRLRPSHPLTPSEWTLLQHTLADLHRYTRRLRPTPRCPHPSPADPHPLGSWD